VSFLGGRADVPDLLLAGDLLVHPAYHENTGTVLLEAIVSGLPVLTVDVCGYAHYVNDAQAGMVMPSPFQQMSFNAALEKMLLSPEREQWRHDALAFAKEADIYSLPEKAANFIDYVGQKRDS
jgi:UDP-glucose:(heptosyl)LPS alpha-1,3-glucosyltransferase